MKTPYQKSMMALIALSLSFMSMNAFAAAATDLSGMAGMIQSTLTPLINLIVASCYLGGAGFCAAAIFKFKAHKDNPTQITIGTPIALLFVAAALLFLPSILGVAGQTMFAGGSTSGPSGSVF